MEYIMIYIEIYIYSDYHESWSQFWLFNLKHEHHFNSFWQDAKLQKCLKAATDGISEFDQKMEPITGKKRKADQSSKKK